MKPTSFPEQTTVWAANQPPYLPLPAYTDDTQTISYWRLTWRERWLVFWRGHVWLRQMNFSQPLQPQLPCVESPFKVPSYPHPPVAG